MTVATPARSRRGPLDPRLIQRGRATRNFLVALSVVGVLASALVVAQARLLSDAIAGVFASHSTHGLGRWGALLMLVFAGRGACAWANTVLAHRAAAAVKSGLRHDLMGARLATGPSMPTGTLVRLVTQGLDDLDGYYAKYLPQLVLAGVVPLVVGATILGQDLWSAVIIAVTLPLIPLFMALIGWTTQAQVNRRLGIATRLANHFADLITGLSTLQVFGRARGPLTGLEKTQEAHRRETLRTLRVTFLSSFALELLATISVALVAVTVGFRVVFDQMDLRSALFVLVLAPEAYLPVRQVGVHYHDAADGMAAAGAALDVIERAESTSGDQRPGPGALVFDHVSYRYPGGDADAVRDLTFTVGSHELVALAGPSGAGKSTVLALAAGLLRPTSGRVLVGGVDLAVADSAAWHRRLAWVGQSPGLLPGTVADNVRLGLDAPDAEVRQALADAGAPHLALDQLVGDDGEGLSAGERRRVGIARALVRVRRGAQVLVLDEPTAGLDSDTERVVVDAVRAHSGSGLVISHRSAVLDAVDRIVPVPAAQGGTGAMDEVTGGLTRDPGGGAEASVPGAIPADRMTDRTTDRTADR